MKFYFKKLWNYEFIMKTSRLVKDSFQLMDLGSIFIFLVYFFIVLHSFHNSYLNFFKKHFLFYSNINLSYRNI